MLSAIVAWSRRHFSSAPSSGGGVPKPIPPEIGASLLAASAPIGIFQTDRMGNFIFVNERWCGFSGLTPSQAAGQGWALAIHPEDRADVWTAWSRSLHGGGFDLEYRLMAPDGRVTWVRSVAVPALDDHGRVVGRIGTVTDISARRRAKQALRDTESHLRAVFDTVLDGIITIDASGVILSSNPAATRIFGWTQEEAVGCDIGMLMPRPDRDRHDGDLATFLRSGQPKVIGIGREVTGLRKDGSTFPLDLSVGEFSAGRARLFVVVARDITERKQAERLQGEFIAAVSHELRTPLTSIRGSLGLVVGAAAGAVPEKARALIEIAHKNSQRLVDLVNDILDVERIQSGRLEFHLTPLDLSDLLEQAVEANRAFADQRKVRLRVAARLPDAMVIADPGRILQVMANLLSNAAKFSPSGARIEVAVTRRGPWLRVSVADHGPGVPKHFRSRVFHRFAQADGTDSRLKGGTGLGLAIAKSIIAGHHGHIGFDSEEGHGATFWFELPASQTVEDGAVRRRMVPAPPAHRPRILHVEDDADLAQVASGVLGDFADVDNAPSLREARRRLSAGRYDLVILDLALPDGSGLELMTELSACRPRPPVLVFTAEPNGTACAGAAGVLVKSVTSNETLAEAARALMGGAAWRS